MGLPDHCKNSFNLPSTTHTSVENVFFKPQRVQRLGSFLYSSLRKNLFMGSLNFGGLGTRQGPVIFLFAYAVQKIILLHCTQDAFWPFQVPSLAFAMGAYDAKRTPRIVSHFCRFQVWFWAGHMVLPW